VAPGGASPRGEPGDRTRAARLKDAEVISLSSADGEKCAQAAIDAVFKWQAKSSTQ
jgi:hypothetical protein